MTGTHRVKISNSAVSFDFEVKRNITIVKGDSGTGKTTLFELVSEHMREGNKSGINLSCDVACAALTDMDWKNQLSHTEKSIVFIDEGADYKASPDFARAIRGTDNYYVIFIRENLYLLPYSVNEIYEIRTSGKYHTFTPMYKERHGHVYGVDAKKARDSSRKILTEDSGAGFQFYDAYFGDEDIQCRTAGGNTSIFRWLSEHLNENVTVIADGAAFGSEMDRVMKLQKQYPDKIRVCLPESFEWMILNSGLIKTDDIEDVMENTSNYADSREYFSWEQFFTKYLVQSTLDTPFKYSKDRINKVYLIKKNSEQIIAALALGV